MYIFFQVTEERLKSFHSNDPHDGHGNKKKGFINIRKEKSNVNSPECTP